jgi:hypothetical protein
MNQEERIDRISHLLAMALDAHDSYENKVLGGQQDQEWPEWLAEYLIGHGLDVLLENELAVEKLSHFLQDVSKRQPPDEPGRPVRPAIARQMVERLA